ncbi:MAG: hypothetical protein Q8Q45_07685 [Methylococcaceae bacterium]|uniref:hypothetical protein n=1 Tax=Methylicorpusculum sp. TaxID=2713644 RepID=UPI0027719AED|nr:hypothetical protein [Methylicorpusculum sp.]MDP3389236.1 hypothetical protein [Methylococcaceae bacterium]MDP3932219.1 hypothetical protein [Methylococcaceae bacterium]MDZ4152555.1 hypothetical protein [Methylicorpusculum sp.]
MKIIHRLTFRYDSKIIAIVNELGIPFKDGFICVCKIAENDARWHELSELLKPFDIVKCGHTLIAEFSKKELDTADYLEIVSKWHHGYPEPSDTIMGFMELTYNVQNYCQKCGIGAFQKAPFRFKKSPVWGQRNILQLNWIFDEYFVKPEIWREVFEPFGIGCRPVVLDKSGRELDSVVQLELTELAELNDLDDLPFDTCASCGRIKYLPITGRFMPPPNKTSAAMFRSNQYFGSGASANRMVIVSQELFAKAQSAGLKGVSYEPCLSKQISN